MSWLYLAAIVVSGLCMTLVDHRWKLFAFDRPRVALTAVTVGFVLFLLWDVVAIELVVYSKGESPGMSGIDVAPELPLEELFFITFLCYITGVFHGAFSKALTDRARRAPRAHGGPR